MNSTKVTRTRKTTIFKLIGPCEILSHGQESKWTRRANESAQTVRRYYRNAMTNVEKQNT